MLADGRGAGARGAASTNSGLRDGGAASTNSGLRARQEEVADRLDMLRRHVGGGWWMRGMRLRDTAGTAMSTDDADTGIDGDGPSGLDLPLAPGEGRASSNAVESTALPQQNIQPWENPAAQPAEAVAESGVQRTGAAAASQGRHRIPAITAGNELERDQDRNTVSSPTSPSSVPQERDRDGVQTPQTPARREGGGRRERGAAWLRYKWFLQTAVELMCLSSTIGLLLLLVALHTHTVNHSSCIPAQQFRNASPAPEVNFAQVFYTVTFT